MQITKETNIAGLLEAYPQTVKVFMEYGLNCVGCMAAAFDSIEHGARAHGMSEEKIETLIEDLNLVANDDAEIEDSKEDSE